MTGKVRVITAKDDDVIVPAGVRMLVRRCCNAVLQCEAFDGDAEVSVTFTDDRRIRELNKEYRNIDKATDVLSFPLGENGEYDLNHDTGAKLLGDIVISMDHARAQSEEYGHSLEREIGFLTVHSMLHLLGYDHETSKKDETEMFTKQDAIMSRLGLER